MRITILLSKKWLLLPVLFFFLHLTAQDGTPDNGFGINGKATFAVSGLQDAANAFALQPDGKMITAGTYINGSSWDFAVARLNSDGSPDITFGIGGKVTTPITIGHNVPWRIALQTDGKIVIAGYGQNAANTDVVIVRYNIDGSLDNTFDGDGKVITDLGSNEVAFAVTIQADGKIIAAGSSIASGQSEPTAFRYNTDGSPDNTFDGDGVAVFPGAPTNDHMREVALQTDGKIVMAGGDNYSGGNYHGEVVRLNANGSPDISFGANGMATLSLNFALFYGMTLQTDGKIIGVGAGSPSVNPGSAGSLIARFNTDGSPDNTFNGNGYHLAQIGYNSGLTGAQQDADGRLVGAGYARFTDPITAAITYDFLLERYTTTGNPDNTFDGDGVLVVQFGFNVDDGASLPAIQPNGKILASGFSFNGSSQDFAIIRVNSALSTLPVSLINFSAFKQGSSALLKWQTASEQNNRGFEIQRSGDGINFLTIGWVNGAGSSSSAIDYSFIDASPSANKNFYRLKQVDMDNRSSFSETRKIDFSKTIDLDIYPNPVSEILHIQLSKNVVQIRILDAMGSLMWQQENTANTLSVAIPLQRFSNGIYIVEALDKAGNRQTKSFIKN